MKNDLENIDQLFKESFDGFEADVDPGIWNAIQSSIGSSSLASTVVGKTLALKVAAGILVVGSLTAVIYTTSINRVASELEVVEQIPPASVALNTESAIAVKSQEKPTVVDLLEEHHPINKHKVISNKKNIEKTPAKEIAVQPEKIKKSVEADIPKEEEPVVVSEKATRSEEKSVVEADVEQQDFVQSEAIENDEIKEVNWEETVQLKKEKRSPSIAKEKIPRRLSPNGDGIGDVLSVEGENIKEFHATILNVTNGKVVFEWFWLEGFWDGRDLMGNKVPKGTYMLQIVASGEDGEPILVNQSVTVY